MSILLSLLLLSITTLACDTKAIVCNTICKQDGDELGIIVKDKCYCANARDIDKVITKVNVKGKIITPKIMYRED